jgi:hypothetical protein
MEICYISGKTDIQQLKLPHHSSSKVELSPAKTILANVIPADTFPTGQTVLQNLNYLTG